MKIYLTFSSLAVELVLLLSHSCWKSSLIHRGISLKGLKTHLIIDQRNLPVFFWLIIQKKPLRSTDVFWFLETFSPLISLASFAAGRYILRYGHPKWDLGLRCGFRSPSLITLSAFVAKSLFKTRKISDLQGFFWDHKKKWQFRDLYMAGAIIAR